MNKLINNTSNKIVGRGLLLLAVFYAVAGIITSGIVLTGVALITLIPLAILTLFLFIGAALLLAAAHTALF
jgi:hypothetical protein